MAPWFLLEGVSDAAGRSCPALSGLGGEDGAEVFTKNLPKMSFCTGTGGAIKHRHTLRDMKLSHIAQELSLWSDGGNPSAWTLTLPLALSPVPFLRNLLHLFPVGVLRALICCVGGLLY